MSAPEVALGALFYVPALVMADEHHLLTPQFGKTGQHGTIVTKPSVAVQFHELIKQQRDVVQRLWTIGVAGDAHGFPRGQTGINSFGGLHQFAAQRAQLVGPLRICDALPLQFFDTLFQFVNWLLKIKGLRTTLHESHSLGVIGVARTG